MAPRPPPSSAPSNRQAVRPIVLLAPPLPGARHTCGLTLSPVKRGSRDILATLKHQCDCPPRSISMGEYVASPRVATGTDAHSFTATEAHALLRPESCHAIVHVAPHETTHTATSTAATSTAATAAAASSATSSLWGSTFTLTNTILGSGTLAVPFAIASSGWLLGTLLLLAIALTTRYSVQLLLAASDRAGAHCAKTYESLGHYTMGAWGTRVAEFTFISGGFGTLVSYVVFVTDLVAAVAGVARADKWLVTLALVAAVVCPLSLSRQIGKLWLASVLAILSVCYVVAFVVVALLLAVDATGRSFAVAPGVQAVRFEPGSVYTLTLLISAFACHNTALPVYEELQDRTLPRMNRAVGSAIAVAFGLYAAIALCGYVQFGAATQDNILLNFSATYVAQHAAVRGPLLVGQLCMALALVLTTPIAMWPFRSCVLSVYLRVKNGRQTPSHRATYREYVTVTVVSLVLIATCSIFVPSVKIPLSIVGSVSGSLLIYILPALFYLLQATGPIWSRKHTGPLLMLGAGVVVGTLGLSVTLYKLYHE
ncbi:unnamed protein product [Hyaloperonospora brassicae]|uniref:Amino acid transporter transmembrane domain-containing protein n=1 Tax=Hyaloperonospora brassicae TaxID=162125 RepID=A0AAV0TYI7_HYABA|nr:unnamed protein product [Hyaloperonospora brassicae]